MHEAVQQNCWEFKNCGREPGGEKAHELGECPAATNTKANGFLGGKNAGKGCAYVTGTFCGGNIQGSFKDKEKNCINCDFYKTLKNHYGAEMGIVHFNQYLTRNHLLTSN